MKIVCAFGEEEKEIHNIKRYMIWIFKSDVRASFFISLIFAVHTSFLYFLSAYGNWFGAYFVFKEVTNDISNEPYTSGTIRAIYAAIYLGLLSTSALRPSFKSLSDGKISAKEIKDIMSREPKI